VQARVNVYRENVQARVIKYKLQDENIVFSLRFLVKIQGNGKRNLHLEP